VRGRTVASRALRARFAEVCPGSMGKLPGNAWALRLLHGGRSDGKCHRKDTAVVVKQFAAGKGEMVG
jgi:hypothetical protein